MRSCTYLIELIKQKKELIKDFEKQIDWTLDQINNGEKPAANSDQFKKLFLDLELQNGLLNRLNFDLKVTKTYELLTQDQAGIEPEYVLKELEIMQKREKDLPEVLQIRIDEEVERLKDQINFQKYERKKESVRNLSDYIQENRLKEFSSVGGIFPSGDVESILNFLETEPGFDKPFLTSVKQINQIDIAFGYYLKTGREIQYKDIWGDYRTELIELPPPEHKIDEHIEMLKEKQIKEILRLMVQLDPDDQDDVTDLIIQKYEEKRKNLEKE